MRVETACDGRIPDIRAADDDLYNVRPPFDRTNVLPGGRPTRNCQSTTCRRTSGHPQGPQGRSLQRECYHAGPRGPLFAQEHI